MPAHPQIDDGFARRLAMFYAASILALGIQMPLFPLWLEAKGLDARLIGLVLTLPMAVRTVGIPLIAREADRRDALRQTILITAVSSALAYGLVGLSSSVLAIIATCALAAVVWPPIVPLTDAYALKGLAARSRAYGPVRLWGSVAYIVGNFLAGFAIDILSAPNLIWLLVAATIVTALVAFTLVPLERAPRPSTEPVKPARLLRNPAFIAAIAAASLIQASHAVYYGFSTLDWIAVGLDGKAIAGLWALGVAAEVVLFAASARLPGWLSPATLIILGGAGGVIRWTAMALGPPTLLLPLLQCLHALTFAATHLGTMAFLVRAAPGLAATAQGYFAITQGIVMAGAMSLSGLLYAAYGSRAYAAMALAALAGGVCGLAAQRFARQPSL